MATNQVADTNWSDLTQVTMLVSDPMYTVIQADVVSRYPQAVIRSIITRLSRSSLAQDVCYVLIATNAISDLGMLGLLTYTLARNGSGGFTGSPVYQGRQPVGMGM
jgi:hypothetical protein